MAQKDKTLEESKRLLTEKAIYIAPRKTGSDSERFVCVNGKPMRLKSGIEVEIPKAYALVLDRATKQGEYAIAYAEKIAEEAEKI